MRVSLSLTSVLAGLMLASPAWTDGASPTAAASPKSKPQARQTNAAASKPACDWIVGRHVVWPPAGVAWPAGLPGVEEMIAAKTDVWGEAALRQPGGPRHEFFAPLLPPLRYVDTDPWLQTARPT